MRLLVTGGAGFIGSNFIRYWLESHPGDSIVNLDSLTYAGREENLKGIDESRYVFMRGDICDPDIVAKAMSDVDIVVHFAAESHVDRSIENPRTFLDTNVMGTYTLLEEARRQGNRLKRFHHISTDEVFGALKLDDAKKFDEETPYAPSSPYSASKAASDHLCRAYHRTYGLPISISNCSNNYGPYQFPEKFIPLMVVNAIRELPLPIYGDGLYVRDWIHVSDHCRGIATCIERGNPGDTYCFGGDVEPANIDVAKEILGFLGKPESLLKYVEDRKGHDRRYAIDSSKAKKTLDWKPEYDFDRGLEQTVRWYVDNRWWWEPLLK